MASGSQPDLGGGALGSAGVIAWVLALGGASLLSVALWVGGGYLWTHPETKLGYAVLKKIGKIEPVKRFEAWEAPLGKFYSPKELAAEFLALSDADLKKRNTALLRSYIRNYAKERDPVTYIHGRFTILEAEQIPPGRFVPSGVALLAQAEEAPGLLIEYVLPSTEEQAAAALGLLRPGMVVTLQKSNDLGAVLRVVRQPDKRLIATVINLLYGEFVLDTQTGAGFACDPPARLEPETGWPVFSKTKEVLARLAPVVPENIAAGVAPVTRPAAPKDVTPKPFVPEDRQQPAVRPPPPGGDLAVTMIPSSGGSPAEVISAAAAESAPADRPPAPSQTPSAPGAQPASPAASPTPGSPPWPLYAGGEAPPARLIGIERLPRLAREGLPPEPLHLGGEFVVSAVGPGGVVLRSKGPELQPFLPNATERGAGDVRIIAEFPPGAKLPARGETVIRDRRRPFAITGISVAPDGSTNVRVREVTVP